MMTWIRDNKGRLADPLLTTVALAMIATYTLGGFGPGITPTTGAFSSAAVQLKESNGATTCYITGSDSGGTVSASNLNNTCSVNALVGSLDQVPEGAILTTTLIVTNVGKLRATVDSMKAGSCEAAAASGNDSYTGSDAGGFCGKVDVTVANTTEGAIDRCVFPTQVAVCPALSNAITLASLSGNTFTTVPLYTLASGASVTYVVSAQLDASATNADQGLTTSVPFTWSIGQ